MKKLLTTVLMVISITSMANDFVQVPRMINCDGNILELPVAGEIEKNDDFTHEITPWGQDYAKVSKIETTISFLDAGCDGTEEYIFDLNDLVKSGSNVISQFVYGKKIVEIMGPIEKSSVQCIAFY